MSEPNYDSFGYALAMGVLQSDLYHKLEDRARAECDEMILRGQGRSQHSKSEPSLDALRAIVKAQEEDRHITYSATSDYLFCAWNALFQAARYALLDDINSESKPKSEAEASS